MSLELVEEEYKRVQWNHKKIKVSVIPYKSNLNLGGALKTVLLNCWTPS